MWIGAIVCFIIAALAIESGEVFIFALTGGIGVLLVYLKLTENKRDERSRKESIQRRFEKSSFASMVLRDLNSRNWDVLNSGSIQVLTDKIITPYKTYEYATYGLDELGSLDCKDLAIYLASFCPVDYKIEEATRKIGYCICKPQTPLKKW